MRVSSRPAALAAFAAAALAAVATLAPSAARAQDFTFDGAVQTTGGDFFYLPFSVPAGTQEIEILHADLSSNNILDWGLDDANGTFRGWGGGNTENAVVGIDRASRSYLTGPIAAGTWRVVVGKAKLVDLPGAYHVEVTLRTAPTLAAQPERTPYVPAAPLSTGPRWYAGDLHVHSRESGDAHPTLDAIAALASNRTLDFVILSDHNTTSQFDFVVDAQSRFPGLLIIPGLEFTTYAGHANAIGVHSWVNHRIGDAGRTIGQAVADVHAQGALFSINHPALNLGDLCIGCAWKHDVPASEIDGVEIANGGWSEVGNLFDPQAIHFWEQVLDSGSHAVALGGSDDHSAGVNEGTYGSPIGDPTTLVYADDLSEASILAGIRAGRTVVKLQGPGDPMVELSADVPFTSAISSAASATFTAHVTGGTGQRVRFIVNGKAENVVDVTSDPFDATLHVAGPARVRAEVVVAGAARTITSHLFLEGHAGSSKGCGCALEKPGDARGSVTGGIAALVLALALARARRDAARARS
ncbi:MAG TPA: CehA/McbA family metallohydrolase [bacterium]|nr:CehA/McbA family metallohydrolase [bacterium]